MHRTKLTITSALGALILGGGGAFLLLRSGPEKTPHHEPIKEQAAQYVKGTQESVTGEKSNSSFEQPPSEVDPVRVLPLLYQTTTAMYTFILTPCRPVQEKKLGDTVACPESRRVSQTPPATTPT